MKKKNDNKHTRRKSLSATLVESNGSNKGFQNPLSWSIGIR